MTFCGLVFDGYQAFNVAIGAIMGGIVTIFVGWWSTKTLRQNLRTMATFINDLSRSLKGNQVLLFDEQGKIVGKAVLVGIAEEKDVALGVTADKARSVGIAEEKNSAGSVEWTKTDPSDAVEDEDHEDEK